MNVRTWERGLAIEVAEAPGMAMYLWFYEWNLFDAFREGEHTPGRRDFPKGVSADGAAGWIRSSGLQLELRAVADGAELTLTATNTSSREWPVVAGIIPCLAPGDFGVPDPQPNEQFVDDGHDRTYFVGPDGLELLRHREIHFNRYLRDEFNRRSREGRLIFSEKWPTSDRDAAGGLLVRESADGAWVAGIAWERYLAAQGHNPWKCLHLAVQLGPLLPGATTSVRGKLYLFPGSKEECLRRFQDAVV